MEPISTDNGWAIGYPGSIEDDAVSAGETWELVCPGGTVAESISVFDRSGCSFCIVILERTSLPANMTNETGEWMLRRKDNGSGDVLLFLLQWSLEIPGSGCVALCGREIPHFHRYPA